MSTASVVKERKFYSNIMTNGDVEISPGVFIEESTRMTYIIDKTTKNLSFITTAGDLYKLGVRNYRFMLKLYDPKLQGVDPYNPLLSPEMMSRISCECKINPWYYLRELSRIPVEGGSVGVGSGVPFILNRGNLASSWCFFNNIDHYLVLPRQIGKTKSTLACILWAFLFASGTNMMFLHLDLPKCTGNLRDLKAQRDALPKFIQGKIIVNDEGEKKTAPGDNVKSVKHPINNNKIETFAGGKTLASADRCGRGLSQAIHFYDEFEFTPFIKTIIDAAGPSYNTSAKNARMNGSPYCRVFTTTPGNIDSEPVATTIDFRQQMYVFNEGLYDMSIEDAKNAIAGSSAIQIVYIEFSYIQLGKDEDWFISTCRVVSNDKIKIKREILLKRIRGSNSSPFEPEDLEEIANNVRPVEEIIQLNKIYPLYVYSPLNKNVPYIVGVDPSGGGVGDYAAVTILDPYTVKPVAELRSNILTHEKMKTMLISMVTKYIPNAILVIEKNSIGQPLIDSLRYSIIGKNLYYDPNKYFIPDANERLDAKGFATVEARNVLSFGIQTTVKVRDTMMTILFNQVREYKDRFVTKFIVDDLNNLVKSPSGKVAAAHGAHDDSIMSYLIAMYTYHHGTNLARYGFVKGDRAPEAQKEKTRKEYFEELPPDMQDAFRDVMEMQTGEDYMEEQRAREEMARQQMRNRTAGVGGTGVEEDFEYDEESGTVDGEGDLSWLDELNS